MLLADGLARERQGVLKSVLGLRLFALSKQRIAQKSERHRDLKLIGRRLPALNRQNGAEHRRAFLKVANVVIRNTEGPAYISFHLGLVG